jgi:FxLD family lantipeptide
MTIGRTEQPPYDGDATEQRQDGADLDDLFDLDIRFIESGPNANTVIAMTDDGCGSTCPSACTTSAV